ncbi:MAG TPA: hypothetical protein VHU21_24885 [Paraburkholderia sp.]|nr:hypothetical protein [Paraburkholderia sp.]
MSVTTASVIVGTSSRPVMIGVLRAVATDASRRSSQSDSSPPATTPIR